MESKGYFLKTQRTERRNEYGESAQRRSWLTANETRFMIPKTNKLRKEGAYGANETGTVHHPAHRQNHLQGQGRVQRDGSGNHGGKDSADDTQ